MNKKKPSAEIFVRSATRIRPDQRKRIADTAKKEKISEGEMHRKIIDYYFNDTEI